MKDIQSYFDNYDEPSSGFSFGKFRDNPGDDTGSALTADLFNDLLYAFYAFINKYGEVSDTDESESASDFVNALEAFAVYKTGDQVMAGELTLRSAGSAARLYMQTAGSGSSGTDGIRIVLNDDGYALINVGEEYYLSLRTNNTERLRLAASTPQITVANNARDLVDSSGYVVADKMRETGSGAGVLNKKIIEIGVWEMYGTASLIKAHGLSWGKIRSVYALIKNDMLTGRYSLERDGYIVVTETNIELYRNASGFFASADFNAPTFERGWIVIEYVD